MTGPTPHRTPPMVARRLCLAGVLLCVAWLVVVMLTVRPTPAAAYRWPVLYAAVALIGYLLTFIPSVVTGRARWTGPPVAPSYRVAWAAGLALLGPLLYPCWVVFSDWMGDTTDAERMIPAGIDPAVAITAGIVCGVAGLLLTSTGPPMTARPAEPPGLGDPLLTLRRMIGGLVAGVGLAAVLLLPITLGDGQIPAPKPLAPRPWHEPEPPTTVPVPGFEALQGVGFLAALFTVFGGPSLLFVWRILPGRRTNAFYLRSFRHDRRTWPVRQAIQAAIGRRFRLSGIRAPGRRVSPLDYLAVLVFVLRYSTPKYMNLEAEDDWKARLWASMGYARCVVIDVSDLTPFVAEEVELSYHRVGLDRILFVGDGSADWAGWRQRVDAVLPAGAPAGDTWVAVWTPDPAGRAAFANAVRAFVRHLPAGSPGPAAPPADLTRPSGQPSFPPTHDGRFWLASFAGLPVVAAVASLALNTVSPSFGEWSGTAFSLVGVGVVAWYLIGYLIDCGSHVERVICLLFAGGLLFLYSTATAARVKVLQVAERQLVANNLKQLALGLQMYGDVTNRLPPGGDAGRRRLSWRVALLPHLGEEPLYRKFRLDEPWDSPHNRRVFEDNPMPRVYLRPRGTDAEARAKRTHYQVFVGNGAVFDRDRPLGLWAVQDDPAHTVLIAVAETPVEWTRPDDLAFDPAGDPRPLLRAENGVTLVAMALGTVEVIPVSRSAADWRALITRAGGEPVRLK